MRRPADRRPNADRRADTDRRVLAVLRAAERPLAHVEIEQRAGVTHRGVTRVVGELASAGRLEIQRGPRQRRGPRDFDGVHCEMTYLATFYSLRG